MRICEKHWVKPAALIAFVALLFLYGVGVGHYRWPPFWIIEEMKKTLTQLRPPPVIQYRGEADLLVYAFTDPVEEKDLYYPPISDLAGIHRANDGILIFRQGFATAYEHLQVSEAEQLTRLQDAMPVVRIRYKYQRRSHEVFAYGRLPVVCEGKNAAGLIIPGTGLNQSLKIAVGDTANYHYGILNALKAGGIRHVYTLIKENEDFLAWHNGNGRKLGPDFILGWHLNREASYSVSFLVDSMAFTKWMQHCFDRTLVAGLSGGGAAVLLSALQSRPDTAIVASGHSVINDLAEWSGRTDLIGVPGYGALSKSQQLFDRLQQSPTNWFFSWGRREVGTYKIEAHEERTAKVISSLPNVRVVIHDNGHTFPVDKIESFLADSHSSGSNPRAN